MDAKLDVRRGIAEANAAFWVAPGLLCAPLVSLGLLMWASDYVTAAPARSVFSLSMFVALLGLVAKLVATVLLAAMFLRIREGREPELAQVGAVLRLRGLWSTLGKLLLRYAGWVIVVGLAGVLVLAVLAMVHVLPTARPGAKTAWSPALFGGVTTALLLVLVAAISRYSFALPLLALLGGAREDLVKLSERIARGVAGTLMLICMLEAVPTAALLVVDVTLRHRGASLPVRLLMGVAHIVILNCLWTWFVLLLTSLTLQRLGGDEGASEILLGEGTGRRGGQPQIPFGNDEDI